MARLFEKGTVYLFFDVLYFLANFDVTFRKTIRCGICGTSFHAKCVGESGTRRTETYVCLSCLETEQVTKKNETNSVFGRS